MKDGDISSNLTYQELCNAAEKGAEALHDLIKDYNGNLKELDRAPFSGDTIMHFAARYAPDSLQLLIDKFGYNAPDIQNADGNTAAHYAARYNPDSLKLLIKTFPGKAFNKQNHFGNTALHWAAKHNKKSLEHFINNFEPSFVLNVANKFGETLTHLAAKRNTESLKLLIESFGEKALKATNTNGETALHIAVQYNTDSLAVLLSRFTERVNELFESELFKVEHDNYKVTISPGSLETYSPTFLANNIKTLLASRDNYCSLAIQFSAGYSVDSLKTLIQVFGEHVLEMIDVDCNTAVHIAALHNQDALKLLIEKFKNKAEKVQSKVIMD